ncbi:MAG: RagB/SusD family nutrient uptake outer membrane protein [Paludibacter sp.]|nr:RagB/SusD family nutrient uptake outer membrane protein [Paludibacter sp.]
MKKYIQILVFALIICINVSCDDYLETKSNSTFTEQSSFENLDFATKAVNGIYSYFTSTYSYGTNLGIYYRCDNDIEWVQSANNGSSNSLSHYAGNDGTGTLSNVWTSLYQTIEQANICIDHLPVSPIWEGSYADKAHILYGEAVTLRALCYYELINIWGDVPFKIKSSQAGDNFYLPKTDRDSIYEYLIEDLKNVEEYVPWMSTTSERVRKGFVKGLRARMALSYAGYSLRNKTFETRRGRYWQDYYVIANQECREIMESGKHQLNPSFENIFKTLQSYSQDLTYKEVLYEVAYGRLYNGVLGMTIGMAFCANPVDPKYGRATSAIRTSPTYYYSFDSKDNRRNVSVELYNYGSATYLSKQVLISNNGIGFSPCKWRKSWINPSMGGSLGSVSNTGVNWPFMRYADIVLMFAETENEINNGPTQAAKDALSAVRKRAFAQTAWATKVTNYVDSVSQDKNKFFNAIVDERAWEFGGEMLRKYDLVRWNLLGTKIREMKENWMKIYSSDPKYANVPTYIFWKYKEDGETLDILNPDYRLPSTAITGYTRSNWLPLLSAAGITSVVNNYMNIIANGYNETKNNYLYPIAATTITDSNGMLSNDQIP